MTLTKKKKKISYSFYLDLQLSILLIGSNSSTPMIMSADISQGFSFQKKIDGGAIVYEHQLNVK